MLRIVGGKWRGRHLEAAEGLAVRPTSDRARESLFNILSGGRLSRPDGTPLLPGAKVLDAFAGTGALGLEALSRGAARVTFVENLAAALEALKINIASFDLDEDQVRLVAQDVLTLGRAPEAHDLILMDPPYNQGLAEPALACLAAGGWMAPGALVVVEQMKGEPLDPPTDFALLDERRYGKARLSFLKYEPL